MILRYANRLPYFKLYSGKVILKGLGCKQRFVGIRVEIEIIAAIFLVIFETTSKFPNSFLRLILKIVEVDGFTWPPRKIDGRYEFRFRVKGLLCK